MNVFRPFKKQSRGSSIYNDLPPLEPASDSSSSTDEDTFQQQEAPPLRRSSASKLQVISTVDGVSTTTDCCHGFSMKPRKVSFGTIKVRLYSITLGDHPDVSEGPPVTIDWDYVELEETRIPVFHGYEISTSLRRRKQALSKMQMSSFTRRRILRKVPGITDKMILQAMEEARKVHHLRVQTYRKLPYEKYEMAFQSLRRKLTKPFGGLLSKG